MSEQSREELEARIAELQDELTACREELSAVVSQRDEERWRELAEALEQQTALSKVLEIIRQFTTSAVPAPCRIGNEQRRCDMRGSLTVQSCFHVAARPPPCPPHFPIGVG
jgi:hypothetical protein